MKRLERVPYYFSERGGRAGYDAMGHFSFPIKGHLGHKVVESFEEGEAGSGSEKGLFPSNVETPTRV